MKQLGSMMVIVHLVHHVHRTHNKPPVQKDIHISVLAPAFSLPMGHWPANPHSRIGKAKLTHGTEARQDKLQYTVKTVT